MEYRLGEFYTASTSFFLLVAALPLIDDTNTAFAFYFATSFVIMRVLAKFKNIRWASDSIAVSYVFQIVIALAIGFACASVALFTGTRRL